MREKTMQLNEIFDIVNHFKSSIPVDVEGLALALRLKVEKQDLKNEICGMIKRTKDSYLIIVNKNHPEVRQRFTIAHEIGHFVFHRNKIGNGVVDNMLYRQISYNGIENHQINQADEQQANNFAANLLMSRSSIEAIGISDIDVLAKRLNVSTAAIKIRLGNLNIPYKTA